MTDERPPLPPFDEAIRRLSSVNIGRIQVVDHNGRQVATGIFKTPTTERQRVAGVHIGEDQQADINAHGGPDKAIYAYASEDIEWWESQLNREIEPGFFGENLTTNGVDVSNARVGDLWHIGTSVLEVSEPRVPCFKLGLRTGVPRIQQLFSESGRPGTYLRILTEGHLIVGDPIVIQPTMLPTVTVGEIARFYHDDHAGAADLVDVEKLSEPWRAWARRASTGADSHLARSLRVTVAHRQQVLTIRIGLNEAQSDPS